MSAAAVVGNSALLAAGVPAWRRFCRALREPKAAQQQILRRLLASNAATSYGRAYGLSEIRCYSQFQSRIPIIDYGDLEPWIKRITQGEKRVLTREPVTRLLPTSGSSGPRKLIPFTPALQREFNAAIKPWMVDLYRTYPNITLGRSYWSVTPAIAEATNETSSVPIGFDDDSAYLGGISRRLVQATFAVPSALRGVEDMACFRYLTLLCLLREPKLRLVSVWHPSFLTLLLDALPALWDELLVDVRQGTCLCAAGLPAEARCAFRGRPQPRRAASLREADCTDPHSLWPDLSVVSCWGDAHAALPLADLRRRLPDVIIQTKGLLSTEAFVSVPFRGSHPIAVTSHFFEFADASGKLHLAHELRAEETYSVIVTTAGGLWRYRLGDLVEVNGFVDATPSLRFLGRGTGTSDLCGEKLSESFVTQAIVAACASSASRPTFAMLAPEREGRDGWHYTLFAEGQLASDLALHLDHQLHANPHYKLCRRLGQLGPLRCFQIASGAYETFCRTSAGAGAQMGDIKPQALSSRSDWGKRFAAASPEHLTMPRPNVDDHAPPEVTPSSLR